MSAFQWPLERVAGLEWQTDFCNCGHRVKLDVFVSLDFIIRYFGKWKVSV